MGLSARSKPRESVVKRTARKTRASAQFTIRGKLSSRSDAIIGAAGILLLLLVWCIVSYGNLIRHNFLPTPTLIWEGLADYYRRDWLFAAIWRSSWRVLRALFFVVLLGVPVGVLLGAFAPLDAFLRKIVNGGKAVPITAMVGLVTLWIGLDDKGKVFYLFLGAIFYMIIMVKNAVASVNDEYLKVALDVGASRWQVIRYVLIPGALPKIWEAIAICIGIMWTYIILAEIVNSNEANLGVGFLIHTGSRLGGNASGKVFGMVIIIALISSLTDFVLTIIREKYMNW